MTYTVTKMSDRYASISVDFEGLKHYFRTMGIESRLKKDAVYEKAVDRFLELFESLGIKATFFVIAEDMAGNEDKIEKIVDAGHEIGNHTLTHPFGFRKMHPDKKRREILDADEAIGDITGKKVLGFRAPCYDIDEDIIDILEKKGYLYDSSVFPSFFNPVMNLCYHFICNGRPLGMGNYMNSLSPTDPYHPGKKLWRRGKRKILEIPITMVPFLRFPFYSTVLFSLGTGFYDISYRFVKSHRTLTYELHSIDLLGLRDDNVHHSLRNHPAMRLNLKKKTKMLTHAIEKIKGNYKILPMMDVAKRTGRWD